MKEIYMNTSSLVASCISAARVINPVPSQFFAVGSTGYLDARFIPKEKVSTGVDGFGRPFITFCIKSVLADGTSRQPSYAVNTAFQRYQGGSDIWTDGSNFEDTFCGTAYDSEMLRKLLRLLSGEAVTINRGGKDRLVELVDPAEIRASDFRTLKYPFSPVVSPADVASARHHAEKPQVLANERPIPPGMRLR
jgi:hypothetical protein